MKTAWQALLLWLLLSWRLWINTRGAAAGSQPAALPCKLGLEDPACTAGLTREGRHTLQAAAASDAELLLSFKGTFENGATLLPSWQSGSDPCSTDWKGVSCANGSVAKVDVRDLGLRRTLTPGTAGWALPNSIQELLLQSNDLRGWLFSTWQLPTSLRTLSMDGNRRLGGSLPAGGWVMPAGIDLLKHVSLANMSLTGSVPPAFLTMLPATTSYLGLAANQLSGPLLALSWQLPAQLEVLDLSSNRFQGSLPSEWVWLSRVKNVSLSNNLLTGPLPERWSFPPGATLLDLSSNQLSGSIPTNWLASSPLRIVRVDGNQLRGSIPTGWSLPNLRAALLQKNWLQGTLPEWTTPMEAMILVLPQNGTGLCGPVPPHPKFYEAKASCAPGNCYSALADSYFPDCPAPGSDAALLLDFKSNFSNGGELLFDWAYARDNPCMGWRGIGCNEAGVSILNCSGLGLQGTVPGQGWTLPKSIHILLLDNNRISGSLPPGFSLPSSLEAFTLSANQLGGTLPAGLSFTSSLKILALDSNQFTGSLPPNWTLPNLTMASFSDNQLTGALPAWDVPANASLQVLPQMGTGLCGQVPPAPIFTREEDGRAEQLTEGSLSNCPLPATSPSPPPAPPRSTGDINSNAASSDSGSNMAAIAGLVAGCAVVAVAAGVLAWRWRQSRKRRRLAAGMAPPWDEKVLGKQAGPGTELDGGQTGTVPSLQNCLQGGPVVVSSDFQELAPATAAGPGSHKGSSAGATLGGSSTRTPATDPDLQTTIDVLRSMSDATEQAAIGSPTIWAGSLRALGMDVSPWTLKFRDLALLRKIGEGSFGRVYLARWKETDVAVKVLSLFVSPAEQVALEAADWGLEAAQPVLQKLQQEAGLMAALRHPNIVGFLGVCPYPPLVVSEFCGRGALNDLLKEGLQSESKARRLDWTRRLGMAMGAARGMLYLHTREPPVLHRDLKSPNLLVSHDWTVKVSDFNLSRILAESIVMSSQVASNPRWLAPEILSGGAATFASDVYAFGIVLWELLTWEIPWAGLNPWQIAKHVLGGGRLPVPEPAALPGGSSSGGGGFEGLPTYLELMNACWAQRPEDRPEFGGVIAALRDLHAGQHAGSHRRS